jgi:hypothetical protein
MFYFVFVWLSVCSTLILFGRTIEIAKEKYDVNEFNIETHDLGENGMPFAWYKRLGLKRNFDKVADEPGMFPASGDCAELLTNLVAGLTKKSQINLWQTKTDSVEIERG